MGDLVLSMWGDYCDLCGEVMCDCDLILRRALHGDEPLDPPRRAAPLSVREAILYSAFLHGLALYALDILSRAYG